MIFWGLDSQWIESKRKGFFEVTGNISAYFSGGTHLKLESRLEGAPFIMKVEGQKKNCTIDENKGIVSDVDGIIATGKNEMQSTMTSRLVDDLLAKRKCRLPKLSESMEIHRVFLRSLLKQWNNVHSKNVDTLPIT